MTLTTGGEDTRLKVTEIFHSIQGESTLAGERFTFVRLTGCPLRCTYCDTTYSYTGGHWMTVEEILGAVRSHGTRWVCLTGGEPLAQKKSIHLVHALREAGLGVTIETDGEEDVAPYAGLARLIMDMKTPSSGEKAEVCFKNLAHLRADDEIKFVIGDEVDYAWAVAQCREYRLTDRFKVLFSPVHGKMGMKELAEKIIGDRLDVRMQAQLHKYIWGENVRGV